MTDPSQSRTEPTMLTAQNVVGPARKPMEGNGRLYRSRAA